MTHRYDAIIVGGGHNGLVAAFYLARAGQSVLVLERRPVVGGPASTIEFFPGFRGAMTNSPGSLEPKIVADMELEHFGLRWVKPDPAVLMPFPDGRKFVGWRDQNKVRELIARDFSRRDAETYPAIFEFFNDFARRMRISLFEPPPTYAEIASRLKTPQDEADFATIFFGSIRQFLERRLESEAMQTAVAVLAWGGAFSPSTPGTPLGLLHRPMSFYSSSAAGTHDPRHQVMRGSTGLPMGGMGSVTQAMRRSIERLGVEVRTEATVAHIIVGPNHEVRGVALENGTEFTAPIVLSNLHPRTTFLGLLDRGHLPDDIQERIEALPIGASAFKVVLAVDEPPLIAGAPPGLEEAYSSCQLRIAPDLNYMETCYQDFLAKRGTECPRLMGLIPTFTDPSMAPEGKHLLSINAWFFPYELAEGSWQTEGAVMGNRILRILTEYFPSLSRSVVDMKVYTPVDLELEFGLIGGNFSHLDQTPGLMFANRPVPGMSDYRTPVRGLYLCGSGAWPGGTVTGLPGHNAGHQVLRDLKAPRHAIKEAT
jgi:phytoene dehydrogenase-like protein